MPEEGPLKFASLSSCNSVPGKGVDNQSMSSHDPCQPCVGVLRPVLVLCDCLCGGSRPVCVLCVTVCARDTERRILRGLENSHVAFEDQKPFNRL